MGAGATLMAAGGSMPELFTSFVGTFRNSAVGFGTIVGSAVFNVLFVIAMVALFSENALKLTWWPLFRDCVYYTLSLGMLATFFEVLGKNKISLVEAGVLLLMYVGYVVVMKYNEKLKAFVERMAKKEDVAPMDKPMNTSVSSSDLVASDGADGVLQLQIDDAKQGED